jgi:hypothetical protein
MVFFSLEKGKEKSLGTRMPFPWPSTDLSLGEHGLGFLWYLKLINY